MIVIHAFTEHDYLQQHQLLSGAPLILAIMITVLVLSKLKN